MKKIFNHILSQLKRPLYYIPLIVIVLGGMYMYFSHSNSSKTQIVTVAPTTFTQTVLVTGTVVPAENVDLGFEMSGRVANVGVAVGDKVSKGQTLAYLSNGDAVANVSQQQALVQSAQAKLEDLQNGTRPEDIALAQSDVDSAQSLIDQSKATLIDQLKDAYVKADDAVLNKVDQLYTNPRSANPQIIAFNGNNTPYDFSTTLNNERIVAGETLTNWESALQSLTTTSYSSADLATARTNLNQIRSFLNDISIAVASLTPNPSLSQTTIDKYSSDISQARSNVSLALSNLTNAEQSLISNQSALQKAQDQLTLKKAGSTQAQIDAQAAQVKSAEAQLENAQALLGKTVISAPIDGIVTKADIKAGEISSPNTPVISLISASKYEMQSYISETDIAKVKVGQTAKVTLDAYGKDVVFDATVTEVDPAETVLSGVSTYKTKFQFATDDDRIKSGMTANITIQTDNRTGVLTVPQQAVTVASDESKTVMVQKAKDNFVAQTVTTGGIDSTGDIEITSGLQSGDVIEIKTP